MQKASYGWYSHRVGRDMGIAVYGHYGLPILAFPTSGGGEWELENMGLIPALAPYVDAGRVKFFTVGSNSDASWYNAGAHPFHRSWMQRMFDEYIRSRSSTTSRGARCRSRRWARRSARSTRRIRSSSIRTR